MPHFSISDINVHRKGLAKYKRGGVSVEDITAGLTALDVLVEGDDERVEVGGEAGPHGLRAPRDDDSLRSGQL